MGRLFIRSGAAPEAVEALVAQFRARPVGFGLLETFIPLPDNQVSSREKYWGLWKDYSVTGEAYSADAGIAIYDDMRPVIDAALKRIFPEIGPFLEYELLFKAPYDTEEDAKKVAPLLKRWRPMRFQPEILKLDNHRCNWCDKHMQAHVGGQCLFASTKFTPKHTDWRTVMGRFTWDASSGSFVAVAGSTTTTTTTRTTNTAPPSSRSRRKKPPANQQ